VDEGLPISYLALEIGTPVVTSTGTQFGTVHHVLQVPELDLFDGISVDTKHGLRFVDRDQITEMTRAAVRCALTDDQAAALPVPRGRLGSRAGDVADRPTGASLRPAPLEEPRRLIHPATIPDSRQRSVALLNKAFW